MLLPEVSSRSGSLTPSQENASEPWSGVVNAGIRGGYRDRGLPCKSQGAQLDNGILPVSFLSALPCLLCLITHSTRGVQDSKARFPANKGD